MMDDLLEVVLEILIEGAVEAAGERRVPLAVRILLGLFLAGAALTVVGLMIWVGIDTGDAALAVFGTVLALAAAGGAAYRVRRFCRRRKKQRL